MNNLIGLFGWPRFRRSLIAVVTIFAGAWTHVVVADTYTWTGAASGDWNNATNWGGSGVPGSADAAIFTGAANPTVSLDGGQSVGSITFDAGAATAFTLGGASDTLTLASGGSIVQAAPSSNAGGVLQTIASPLLLQGSATFSGDPNAGTPSQSDALQIAGPITGDNTINIVGSGSSGNVLLTGDNSGFTGNWQVASGSLIVGASDSLGTTATVTMSGGQVWFNGGADTQVNYTIAAGGGTWNSYSSNSQSGNIQVDAGATWTIGNGGGNSLTLSGVISGSGAIQMQFDNTTLSGTASNSFSGTITDSANSGTAAYDDLYLAKTGGALAISGPLVLQNQANVIWEGNNQIAAAAPITLSGGALTPNGYSNSLGALTLNGSAFVNVAGDGGALHFADSSGNAASWTAGSQLLVQNWSSTSGNIYFGSSASGLTAAQLADIGFVNPTGQAPGLYTAQIGANGQITPTTTAVQPINPPFDVSGAAQAARAAVYGVPGLANLTGAGTPLTAGEHISFFGDSITWLNTYITDINSGLASGAGTKNLGIETFNHGINGGGVADILNGSTGSGYNGGSNNAAQAPFADVIAADHSNVAVVYIGVNDVRLLGTSAATFQADLTTIVQEGEAAGVKMILATVSVAGELPVDGTNTIVGNFDSEMDSFAQITRNVATATGATLVDLRTDYLDYEQNNNWQLQLNGSLLSQSDGVLTYDGIHPTATGAMLLANLLSQGIYQATIVPEPSTIALWATGLLSLAGHAWLRRRAAARRNQGLSLKAESRAHSLDSYRAAFRS